MDVLEKKGTSYKLKDAIKLLAEKIRWLINGNVAGDEKNRCLRLEWRVEKQDILAWLNQQMAPVKIYWTTRGEQFQVAGIGSAHTVEGKSPIDYAAVFKRLQKFLTPDLPHLRYYGGICFDANNCDSQWINFGTYRFTIPQFELSRRGEDMTFACNLIIPDEDKDYLNAVLENIADLTSSASAFPAKIPEPKGREDHPNQEQWNFRVDGILGALEKGRYEKIVLARRSVLTFDQPLNPFQVMQRLEAITADCFLFCYQCKEGEVFLGASPERLYQRAQGDLKTEAIAGSRPRGQTPTQDKDLINELTSSEKEGREHALVACLIDEKLRALCTDVTADSSPALLHLKGAHHLITRFSARLRPEIEDAQLLKALHPTPAIAGLPTEQALIEIKNREPFSRGWYAGPIGYVGLNQSEFAVAIRSGLVKNNQLNLYAGAGIVKGSTPHQEWDETEHKLNSFLKIFLP